MGIERGMSKGASKSRAFRQNLRAEGAYYPNHLSASSTHRPECIALHLYQASRSMSAISLNGSDAAH